MLAGKSVELIHRGESGDHFPRGSGKRSRWLAIPGNESLGLRGSDWEIEVAALPEALDGLSVLHLSDLHFSDAYDRRYFERVADEASRQEVDLVALHRRFDRQPRFDRLDQRRSCRGSRVGSASTRSSATTTSPRISGRFIDPSAAPGFKVLEGRWARLDVDGSTLALGGTSAPWGRRIDRHSIPEADVRILLSHTPDRLYEAASLGIDLVLSGHNHGGQVRVPVIGPILMPSRYSRRFDLGFFREGKTLLHVSAGVGAKHPLRINCPPEITRLVMRSAGRIGKASVACEDREEEAVSL